MKYDKQNLIDTARSFERDDFVFFWGHTDRMGGVGKVCLSQWYMCSFAVEDEKVMYIYMDECKLKPAAIFSLLIEMRL